MIYKINVSDGEIFCRCIYPGLKRMGIKYEHKSTFKIILEHILLKNGILIQKPYEIGICPFCNRVINILFSNPLFTYKFNLLC